MPRITGALVVVLALASTLIAPAIARGQGQDVLPDLDQQVPTGLEVKRLDLGAKKVFRLGFDSAAANVGDGPLTLFGHRATRSDPTMDVNQLVTQRAGQARVVRDVGVMSYVVHPDHKHWHLLGFEKYEIRATDGTATPLRRDRKTGFCLGDRYAIPNAAALAGFSPTPLQGDTCGLGRPDLLGLFAGISVGYGDNYTAQLEGQFIDITGLPSGRYVLTHTVNTDGRLLELDYTNNASSVLFSLSWREDRDEVPRVRVLRRCPMSPDCPPNPPGGSR
jgi:Lysyl oxidase